MRVPMQPATVVAELKLTENWACARRCPSGYSSRSRRLGGGKRQGAGADRAVVPLMLFIMATILMIQLAELSAAVPGIRGRAAGADRRRRGAVAKPCAARFRRHPRRAGAVGILIRNSVILIVQIEESG